MENIIENKVEVKQGYKKTAVGVVPEVWKVKELGDLCRDICGEYGANKSAIPYSSDLPRYVRITDIDDEGNLHFDSKVSADLSSEEEKKFKLKHHDLLFARTGATVGKSYLHRNETDKSFVYAGFLIRFRLCPNKVNPIFIREYTNTSKYWHWVKTYSARSGQPGLNSNEYKSLKLPIPPLPEQKAIADCLSTWDKGIEKLSALIASKKEQKKGLMQQLLTGKKRLDGFTEEWKEVRLGKYFKERNQRGFNDLDLLSIGEEGVYPQSDSNKKDTSNSDKSKYKLIEIGDLGYNTMRLWQGRIALSNIRGIVSPAYTILIPQTGKVNSNYYSYLFKMPFVVNKFYRNSQGMVSDTLTCRYNDFKKIKLFIPSIEEQAAITEVLTTADKEIELLEQKLASFKMQKKGLMQVLLTGEKRLIK